MLLVCSTLTLPQFQFGEALTDRMRDFKNACSQSARATKLVKKREKMIVAQNRMLASALLIRVINDPNLHLLITNNNNIYCQRSHCNVYRENPLSTHSPFSLTRVLFTWLFSSIVFQRPRAKPDAILAAQAVVRQVEPTPAAESAPLQDENANPLPEQLEVFLYFLFSIVFPLWVFFPFCPLALWYSSFLFSLYAFVLSLVFFLLFLF